METIKKALEAALESLDAIGTPQEWDCRPLLHEALSELEAREVLTDEEIERLAYMPGLGIAMSGQPYVSEVTDKMADHAAECMRYARDHGYLSPQPLDKARSVDWVRLEGEQADPAGTMIVTVGFDDGTSAELIRSSANIIYHMARLTALEHEQPKEPLRYVMSGLAKEAMEVRHEFAAFVLDHYGVTDHAELRTHIDSLLIMFDQLVESPKEQGAEPVALAQEVMKVWNEDGDGGEIQKKTPIAWYRVTRLAEEILAGKCIPTSREKAMEEAGDALIAKEREYRKLIGADAEETIHIAAAHGWQSSRYEAGVKLRSEIEQLQSRYDAIKSTN